MKNNMMRHIGIVTDNLDKMLKFYKELFNFSIIQKSNETGVFIETIIGIKNVNVTTVKLGYNNQTVIELLNYTNPISNKKKPKKLNETGITHFALNVKSLDNIFKFVQKNKIKYLSPPQKNTNNTVKVFFCQDPDGNYLELVEKV